MLEPSLCFTLRIAFETLDILNQIYLKKVIATTFLLFHKVFPKGNTAIFFVSSGNDFCIAIIFVTLLPLFVL